MGAMPGSNTVATPPIMVLGICRWLVHSVQFGHCYKDFNSSVKKLPTFQGLWLMPEPQCARVFMFTSPGEEDVETSVDFIRPLRIQQVT